MITSSDKGILSFIVLHLITWLILSTLETDDIHGNVTDDSIASSGRPYCKIHKYK